MAYMTGRLPYKGRRIGRLIVTTCRTATGAPVAEDSFTHDQEGNRYHSKTILLTPWRKNKYGERLAQRAFVVGWREAALAKTPRS